MANLIGQILLNQYRVDSFIASGGMGAVYRVFDLKRNVPLAMKVLHADLARDKVFLRRFEREAQILNQLQHPYIVRFYGLEQEGLQAFLLMDYVQGSTLRDEIFQLTDPMRGRRIFEVMHPICSALNYAHQMGLIHCDVKPANILIQENNNVVVTDFGIARLIENSTTMTMAGAGTPAYMAPEQILGKNPVPQTDIYALGIILYEMLTIGERPFTGEYAKTAGSTSERVRWEHLNLLPPLPRKYNPNISPQMESVVLKCLEKQPAKRYQDIPAFLNALQLALKEDALPAMEIANNPLGLYPSLEIMQADLPHQKMESRKPSKLPARTIAWLTAGFLGIALFIAFIKLPPKPEVTIPPTYTPTHTPTATSISTPTVTPTSTLTPTPGIGSTMRGADGAILVFVPAGEFTMGSNIDSVFAECQKYRTDCKRDWFTDEESPHIVNLNAFWIDQTEVTNEMYAKCVDAGKCTPPSNTDHFSNSDYGNHPVVYVDWNDANTYCSWAERRLPTEAEWEKAARGTDGRTYPWGENIDINFANYDSSVGGTSPVGSYESGKSPYAVYDMAGNVWEWVNDWYSETYYQVSPLLSPVGPDMGIDGIIRGGSWGVDYYEIRSSSRSRDSRNDADIYIGFRCARSQ